MFIDESTLVHNFLERSAGNYPDRCALVQDERRVSYGELDAAANSLAAWLYACGVDRGDRVVILLGNGYEYVVSYYAILKAGAVAVPLNPEMKAAGLQPILDLLEPKGVILGRRQHVALTEAGLLTTGIQALLVTDVGSLPRAKGCRALTWDEVVTGKPCLFPERALESNDLASIIFTSGSTGAPKGVMLTHRNISANADSIIRYLQLCRDDIQMVVLPFFYVMGKSLLNTHFAVGGRVVINNRFAFPAAVVRQMAEEQVTGFSGVPSTYAHLLHKSPLASYRDRLTALRYCSQAGGHMDRTTKERLMQVLPERTQLFVMYGATEASARLSYVEPERLHEKIDSIGRPIPGVQMQVLGDDGAELPTGQVGELVASGANITPGYWRNPGATRTALSEHGYHTGDLGYRDRDGYFFLAGRKDHQLKIGGHRINPVEIEETLMSTGLCIEAVVLGLDDRLQGQKMVALVVPCEEGCSGQQIVRACAAHLPRHKLPGEVGCVTELAKNASGKIDRKGCLEMASRQFH